MLNLFEITAFDPARLRASIASCPGKLFFLTAEFIRKYWPVAELPADKLAESLAFAETLQQSDNLRYLAWHLHRYMMLTPIAEMKPEDLPDIFDDLGIRSGLLYLFVGLSMIPGYIARAERENFPVNYAEAGAKRLGTTTVFFAQMYDGAFGLRGRTLIFQRHYLETATWRIGRFDFVIIQADETFPEIYRKDDRIVVFCPEGMPLNHKFDRAAPDEKILYTAGIERTSNSVSGIPIDPATGLASPQTLTLDLNAGWKKVCGIGDWTLFFHIPGGGGMTLELCRESFREALEFFHSYAPDKNFKAIWSASWIFNPAWRELIPDSNMANLIRFGNLFPVLSLNNPGMYFVFGKNDGDPEEFKAVNTVEKAVLQCYRENRLRRVGWVIMPDQC